MEKKRVQDVAKELGVKPKEIIDFLKEWSSEKKKWSNFSVLEDDQIDMIYDAFGRPVQEEAPQDQAQTVEEGTKAQEVEEEEEIKVEEKPIEEVIAEVLGKDVKEKPKEREERKPKVEKKPKKRGVREFKKPTVAEQKPKGQPVEEKAEKKEEKTEPVKEKVSKEEEQILKKLQQQIEREKKKEEKRQQQKKKEEEIKIIQIPEVITVRDLSDLLGVPANKVIAELMKRGILATINQNVPPEVAVEIAETFGFLAEVKEEKEEEPLIEEVEDRPEDLKPRPPVVVVMGHVDHGKTTLLDTIRKTNVAEREKGGITQHIGASVVEVNGRRITFLDTPGHEAFTSLRARGAQITDIAVLVVAADDGVMPQTVEAINHAKAFNVPIIVAVNKIDKPEADPMKVRRELSDHGLIPEEWGGDTIFVDVSAKTGQNVDQLLEMILLLADILDLKANPKKRAKGVIIETKLDRKRGPVATVIVQEGTLKVGDVFVAGTTYGRVRAMFDDKGRPVREAGPSTPVEVLGFEDLPEAGNTLVVVDSERKAREVAEKIRMKKEKEEKTAQSIKLEDIYKKIEAGETKELKLIVKADTMGSLEALKKSLEELSTEEVAVRVIHGAVGGITENDVMLAKASDAIIIGFNTRPDPKARDLIDKEKVDVRTYGIIYQVIDDIKKALQGLLEPVEREEVLGSAEVRATFKIKKVGTVAGCYVLEGKIVRGAKARLIREGVVVYEGEIESLKRFKEDVQEVTRGYECGIKLKDFNDVKVGDVIECYEIRLDQPTL